MIPLPSGTAAGHGFGKKHDRTFTYSRLAASMICNMICRCLCCMLALPCRRYRGRPHFGKNYDRTFTYSKCPIADRHPQWQKWTAAAAQHDPLGLFASPLVATVLRNGSYTAYAGCGIDGGCFCESDDHCRLPSQGTSYGWRCLPSKAFPEFKACRPV